MLCPAEQNLIVSPLCKKLRTAELSNALLSSAFQFGSKFARQCSQPEQRKTDSTNLHEAKWVSGFRCLDLDHVTVDITTWFALPSDEARGLFLFLFKRSCFQVRRRGRWVRRVHSAIHACEKLLQEDKVRSDTSNHYTRDSH